MATPPTLHVLLAAGPQAPGARALLARALDLAGQGRPLRLLLSAEGLEWARAGRPSGWEAVADIAVCSQQARAAGWSARTSPPGVRWSSVATWLAELGDGPAELWTALP